MEIYHWLHQKLLKNGRKSETENEAVTILTGIISEPTGYGRVIRENNKITEIIEEKN